MKVTYTYDPPLTAQQVEDQLGADARRIMELMIVQEAVTHNGGIVTMLVARHLGYDELADQLLAAIAELGERGDIKPVAGFTLDKQRHIAAYVKPDGPNDVDLVRLGPDL